MSGLLDKINKIIDKIGKRNFILVIFILFVIIVSGLYGTFALFTASDNYSIIDGIKTYKFILNANNTTNSITIPANSSKYVAITVSNSESSKLKYGIYYSSVDDLTSVDLGYLKDSEHLAQGTINSKQDYVVDIKIDNNSSNYVTIDFGLAYGLESGGELVLKTGAQWVGVKNDILLNTVEVGSYVKYKGINGCNGNSCKGENANYNSDFDTGYCFNSNYMFNVSGWRVGYIKDNTAYLVSAGAVECLNYLKEPVALNEFVIDLNNVSLKYCNSNYAYAGKCDSNSTWAFNTNDFKNITGKELSLDSCLQSENDVACGYNNGLIDNGGYYWIADNTNAFSWNSGTKYIVSDIVTNSMGVRPVIRMDPFITVIGGAGTYEDPYIIENS